MLQIEERQAQLMRGLESCLAEKKRRARELVAARTWCASVAETGSFSVC